MSKSAERGKGCDMYRHTFYLISGETIEIQSEVKELSHAAFGQESAFIGSDNEKFYTIPLFSVGYIETEEIE
jgi:hypothetical protein